MCQETKIKKQRDARPKNEKNSSCQTTWKLYSIQTKATITTNDVGCEANMVE